MASGKSEEYSKAGVDIDAASEWVSRIKRLASKTEMTQFCQWEAFQPLRYGEIWFQEPGAGFRG